MRGIKSVLAASALFVAAGLSTAAPASAQISVGIGVAPSCPYGYYNYAPYNCSPYGYYGPEWFNGGVFVGAGPWFHGRPGWHGYINHAYDPHYGYRGGYPHRGEAFHEPADHWGGFHASHQMDEHGHESEFHGHR